jgi:hypothetical protein
MVWNCFCFLYLSYIIYLCLYIAIYRKLVKNTSHNNIFNTRSTCHVRLANVCRQVLVLILLLATCLPCFSESPWENFICLAQIVSLIGQIVSLISSFNSIAKGKSSLVDWVLTEDRTPLDYSYCSQLWHNHWSSHRFQRKNNNSRSKIWAGSAYTHAQGVRRPRASKICEHQFKILRIYNISYILFILIKYQTRINRLIVMF